MIVSCPATPPPTGEGIIGVLRVLTTDLTSAFLVGREVARYPLDRGHGKIINICSMQTDLARPSIAAYTAAKGGLRNLTRAMTAEWASGGLQINGIAPGYIHTEMTQTLVDDPAFNAWIPGRTPAARWGTVDDLVRPAIFFASTASDYINGQVVHRWRYYRGRLKSSRCSGPTRCWTLVLRPDGR
jgi:gluconate 5-dehydrogenase